MRTGTVFSMGRCALALVAGLVAAGATAADAPVVGSRPAVMEQRMRLVDRLLKQAGPEGTADAHAALGRAREAAAAGDLERAEQFVVEAQRAAMTAYRAGGDRRAEERDQDRFDRRRAEVQSFASAFGTMLAEEGGSAQARQDQVAAAELVRRADERAAARDFASGEALLTAAYERLVLGFKRMKDSQTVEYRLTFASPEEEYRYEIRRFGTYELLLDQRLAQGGVAEGDIAALNDARNAAHRLARVAEASATRGDFESALREREHATEQLIVALRRSGMMLP